MASPLPTTVLPTTSPFIDTRLCITQFHYAMDGSYTSDLFFSHGQSRQVSWKSQVTGLSTPWHGTWSLEPGNILFVQFDYLGKSKQKFTQIHLPTLVGRDYLQRRIVIKRVKSLHFDTDQASYVKMDYTNSPSFQM